MTKPQPQLATYKKELGLYGRLNGPVDNHVSACMSCHSTAQFRSAAPMIPPRDTPTPLKWFRNLRGNQAFSDDQISLDYSLQIALSLQNFCKSEAGKDSSACKNATPEMLISGESDDPGQPIDGTLPAVAEDRCRDAAAQ